MRGRGLRGSAARRRRAPCAAASSRPGITTVPLAERVAAAPLALRALAGFGALPLGCPPRTEARGRWLCGKHCGQPAYAAFPLLRGVLKLHVYHVGHEITVLVVQFRCACAFGQILAHIVDAASGPQRFFHEIL